MIMTDGIDDDSNDDDVDGVDDETDDENNSDVEDDDDYYDSDDGQPIADNIGNHFHCRHKLVPYLVEKKYLQSLDGH